jgi:hypothetical protein
MSAYAAGEPGNQSPREGTATHDPQTTSQMVPGMDDGMGAMSSRGLETEPRDRYREDYYPERGYRGGGGYRDERYRGWDDRDYDRQRDYSDNGRQRGGQGGGNSGGFTDDASRFARQHLRTGETKEFFKTSEFFLTLIGAATLIIAAAVQDTFDAPEMWRLFTYLFVAYIISRGIAKAGSSKSDNRAGRNNN